jgi:hypothetical protein
MLIIDRLNDSAYQRLRMRSVDTGLPIDFAFNYNPTQQTWVMALQYENIRVKGLAVVNSINLLLQYKNLIPFGLYVNTDDGFDPYYIDDFVNGRVTIALLDSIEINSVDEIIR